jgi:hypothetical protein
MTLLSLLPKNVVGHRGGDRGKSRGLVLKKRKGFDHNKKQAVDVAEPSINCNKLSLSQVDAEDEETSNIAPNTLVEDESDSEIGRTNESCKSAPAVHGSSRMCWMSSTAWRKFGRRVAFL